MGEKVNTKGQPIMVATDFGARADRAIDRALMLGDQLDRPVAAVHALDYMAADNADWALLDQKMRASIGDTSDDVEFLYPEGSPPAAIARAADNHDAFMLVMGPARYNSIGDFFLGTAVDYVLRNTEKPVLVVKQRARKPYRDIVVGTDFSPASRHTVLACAKIFPGCKLHVVHAFRVPYESWQKADYVREETREGEQKQLDTFMEDLRSRLDDKVELTSALVYGGAHAAMCKELDKHGAQLVALGSHGASGFRQAVIGSTTSDLLRSLPADVMVVNTRAAEE